MESSAGQKGSEAEVAAEQEAHEHVPHRPVVNWNKQQRTKYTRGDRAADVLRDRLGSWGFVIGFLAIMVVWAAINFLPFAWDPYPFILLNLFLSMLAGLQGAILLIAAKRQDAVAAALAEHDYATNVAAKHDIEELIKLNKKQLLLIEDLLEREEKRP